MKKKILQNGEAWETISFINILPIFGLLYGCIRLWIHAHGDSVESLGAQYYLRVLFPLIIVERSEKIARGRVHFLVVANVIGDYEIATITQNKQNKVEQPALLELLQSLDRLLPEGARLIFHDLCGKLSASGAVLEYF